MNTATFGRLFWKEYRAQRGLWLGIIAIIMLIQLLVFNLQLPNQHNPLPPLMMIGLVLSAFYALGSTAVLFAGEREEGTDRWLRILPLGSFSVVGSKLTWTILSWGLSMGVSLLFAMLISHSNSKVDLSRNHIQSFDLFAYGIMMPLLGVFFSLICRRVYVAIALASAALVLFGFVVSYANPLVYFVAMPGLLLANIALGRRWLQTDGVIALDLLGKRVKQFTLEDALALPVETSPSWRFFKQELWLEWRQARGGMFLAAGFAALLLCYFNFIPSDAPGPLTWLVLFAFVPLMFGTAVFRGEQAEQRFRFQGNRGVSPVALWLAKQTVWIPAMLVAQLVLFVFLLTSVEKMVRTPWAQYSFHRLYPFPQVFLPEYVLNEMLLSPSRFLWTTLGVGVLTYSLCQFCSLIFSRSILAGAISIVVSCGVWLWMLSGIMLDVPFVISVGLPVVLVGGLSLWQTGRWLTERDSPRDNLRLAGMATLLFLMVVSSWASWRILEPVLPEPLALGSALSPPVGGVLGVLAIFAGRVHSIIPIYFGLLLLIVTVCGLQRPLGRLLRGRAKQVFLGYCVLHIGLSFGLVATAKFMWQSSFDDRLANAVPALRPTEAALVTGEMYRRASDLLSVRFPIPERKEGDEDRDQRLDWTRHYFQTWESTTEEQRAWLTEADEVLGLLMQATARPLCAFEDQFDPNMWMRQTTLHNPSDSGLHLLRMKALEAESRGELAEAWKFHLAGLKMIVHFTQFQNPTNRSWLINNDLVRFLNFDLPRWAARKEQTPELLTSATNDLVTELERVETFYKAVHREGFHTLWTYNGNYLGAWFTGNDFDPDSLYGGAQQLTNVLPWEQTRAEMVLWEMFQHRDEVTKAVMNSQSYKFGAEIEERELWRLTKTGEQPIWRGVEALADTVKLNHVAEATPVWAVATTNGIEGLGYVSDRMSWQIIHELQFIRERRIAFLRLGWALHRLQTDEELHTVAELLESESAKPLLDLAGRFENRSIELGTNWDWGQDPYGMLPRSPISNTTIQIDFERVHEMQFPEEEYQRP